MYLEQVVPLLPGDQVVFFTDGVIEAVNADGDVFGSDRIDAGPRRRAGAAPSNSSRRILRELTAFTAGQPGGRRPDPGGGAAGLNVCCFVPGSAGVPPASRTDSAANRRTPYVTDPSTLSGRHALALPGEPHHDSTSQREAKVRMPAASVGCAAAHRSSKKMNCVNVSFGLNHAAVRRGQRPSCLHACAMCGVTFTQSNFGLRLLRPSLKSFARKRGRAGASPAGGRSRSCSQSE